MRNDFAAFMLVYFLGQVLFYYVCVSLCVCVCVCVCDVAGFSVPLGTKFIVDGDNKRTRRNRTYRSILAVNYIWRFKHIESAMKPQENV